MIYLDHAAATPVSDKVFEAMKPYFLHDFFNPSAAYLPAKKVAADYETAKGVIAHAIGAKASDLVITAGATEANNLAFTVITDDILHSGPRPSGPSPRADGANSRAAALRNAPSRSISSLLYLETEHDSVRKVAERYGGEAVRVLPSGVIDLDDLKSKITDETQLISVSLANNELGTIQPLAEIAGIIREIKIDRLRRGIKTQLLLHSDASQALNLLDINVARLGVDLLTLNSAKVYGPKGVGALYVSHDARLKPVIYGGGQENGLRSGTENVPAIAGLGVAAREIYADFDNNIDRMYKLRDRFISEVTKIDGVTVNGPLDHSGAPHIISVSVSGVRAEVLLHALEDRNIYVSAGSACSSNKPAISKTLKAIGLDQKLLDSTVRFSFSIHTTEEEVDYAVSALQELVPMLSKYTRH